MALDDLGRLASAVEDNWCDAWLSLGRLRVVPETHAEACPQYVRVWTPGAPEMLLNIVMRFRSASEVHVADIEQAIEPFRANNLPFQWWLTPGTDPPGLRSSLRAIGMQTWGGSAAMTLNLTSWQATPPPLVPNAALRAVRSVEDGAQALDVICTVFSVPAGPMARWTIQNPAFTLYIGTLGDHVAAALATLRQGKTIGFYHVATMPRARRRGLAGNLMALALRDAQSAGCTLATLTATPEARHLYELLGFRTCGSIEQWVPGSALSWQLMYGGAQ